MGNEKRSHRRNGGEAERGGGVMLDMLVAVVLVGFPISFSWFVMYCIGRADGYDKAKAEAKEQSK
jgi:hypothetical protein